MKGSRAKRGEKRKGEEEKKKEKRKREKEKKEKGKNRRKGDRKENERKEIGERGGEKEKWGRKSQALLLPSQHLGRQMVQP